jgi:hypothetical protein
MRTRNDATRPTSTDLEATPPIRKRRARATPSSTRRRPRADGMPGRDSTDPAVLGSVSLYREEKARRATAADGALMAEAKRVYDEHVAESGMKRAGMRSSVVSVGRRAKPAAAD